MATRKFVSEFAVQMVGLGVLLFQQEDFYQLEHPIVAAKLAESPCHIYVICRRPRVTYDPASLKLSRDGFSGRFLIQKGTIFTSYDFEGANNTGVNNPRIECPYPHTELLAFDHDGVRIHRSKAALMAREIGSPELRKELALEVLYVGQAYGTNGKRTAPDRLRSHSTLQAIYSRAISKSPDQEIWISLWSFDAKLLLSMDGRWSEYERTLDEDDAHLDQVWDTPLNEQQKINFTEAAIIHYFQPEFNIQFKNEFPSPVHSTYAQCYNLDLNSLVVEMNTEHFGAWFWSPHVAATPHHLIRYQFHSLEERRSMFEYLVPDEYQKDLVPDPSPEVDC